MSNVDRLIDIARSAVGLTWDDAVLRSLCGPGEAPLRQRQLSRLSTCALFLRGCLAYTIMHCETPWSTEDVVAWLEDDAREIGGAGVPPALWAPYKIGRAMADLVAVMDSSHEPGRIVPGCMVMVGRPGHEHVYLVESIERDGWPDGSYEVVAIEAGQVDADGRQCVRRKRHEISAAGADVAMPYHVDAAVDEPWSYGHERPVVWILDPRPLLGGA